MKTLKNYTLYLAWIVSLISTFGSLYFSEVMEYIPCELCWYQRIFMYPLAILLGIAAFFDDKKIKKYVLPLSIGGGLIALYHYALQKIPALSTVVKPCQKGIPCNVDYIDWLGFITIPFLALIGFTLITVCMLLTRTKE